MMHRLHHQPVMQSDASGALHLHHHHPLLGVWGVAVQEKSGAVR